MRKKILKLIGRMIAIIIAFLIIAILQSPGLAVGLYLGNYLTLFRLFAFSGGVIFGILATYYVMANNVKKLLNEVETQSEMLKEARSMLKKAMTALEQHQKVQMDNLLSFMQTFYENTPISHHIVQLTQQGPKIKIGNEDRVIEVDLEILKNDGIIAALEQARLAWQAEERNET